MTADELIPILKALHADPTCAPMMADWFEERGDGRMANWLRHIPVKPTDGKHWLLCRLAQQDFPSSPAVRRALDAEAVNRLRGHMREAELLVGEDKLFDIGYQITRVIEYEVRNRVQMETAVRPDGWRMVSVTTLETAAKQDFNFYIERRPDMSLFTLTAGRQVFPSALPLPDVVTLRYRPLVVNTTLMTLDNRSLSAKVDLWFGVSGLGDVYVSRVDPCHITPVSSL